MVGAMEATLSAVLPSFSRRSFSNVAPTSFAPSLEEERKSPAKSPLRRRRPSRRTSEGIYRDAKKELSRLLRTEAAVLGVERKSRSSSQKFGNLWPRSLLKALDDAISGNRWESALEIFELLRRQQWYKPRSQTYAKLLMMLGKCGQPERASCVFRIMISEHLKPTLDVYTSLVGAYGLSGLLEKALETIEEMKVISDCKPNSYTYTILIGCCCKLKHLDRIPTLLKEMSYLGIECSSVTYNTVIDGFGKAGMLDEMENFLSEMIEGGGCLPDVVTLNSILSAYGNKKKIYEMERWFEKFRIMGIEPDVSTFNILIKSYGLSGMFEKMEKVLKYMEGRFFSPDTVTYNIIIDSFGKFREIERMESFFRSMKYRGIKPNSVTYCSLVKCYSDAGLIEKVPMIIRQIKNSDVKLDSTFFNCVISAYGNAGILDVMKEMFIFMKEMKCKPDKITFASMIQVYIKHGMVDAASELETKLGALNKNFLKFSSAVDQNL